MNICEYRTLQYASQKQTAKHPSTDSLACQKYKTLYSATGLIRETGAWYFLPPPKKYQPVLKKTAAENMTMAQLNVVASGSAAPGQGVQKKQYRQ
jgi:hypothetical protein